MRSFLSVERELRDTVAGEVWFDTRTRTEYSTATCMYKVMPVGVAAPKTVQDVQRVVRVCADHSIAVIARGGATGLVGQAVGFGIIVDFTKHLNRIVAVSEDDSSVTVESGCVLDAVNKALRTRGNMYPVDPQSSKNCTIGGTVATNAAGSHGLKYGSTKNHVKSLTVVLSNGDSVVLKPNERENRLTDNARTRFSSVKEILVRNRRLIEEHRPTVEKYSSGYNIFESLDDGNFDATRLFCGSEGTLGLVTEATLATVSVPKRIAAALAYFDTYEQTAEAVRVARGFSPSAIELLDKSYTEVGKGLSRTSDKFIGRDFQTMLLIEFEGEDDRSLRADIEKLRIALGRSGGLVDWTPLQNDAERESMWLLRERVSEQLNNLHSRERKISTIEDGAVPLQNLPVYLEGLRRILGSYSIPFTLYGHAGMGHIHCTTFVEIETRSGRERLDSATREVFELITALGGTLSGEHGDGYVRTPFLERAFGKDIYGVFREIKETLDPQNILNPQKIVGTQDGLFLHDIKYA